MDWGRFWWWVVLALVQLGMNGCFGCWEQERLALMQLKASSLNYTYASSWDSDNRKSDCCEWEGVMCNITSRRVIELIMNLSFVQDLDLSKNHFSGSTPLHFAMGSHYLMFLKLSYNNFSGQIFPTNFNLTKLTFLYLDNNQFSGTILKSISQMKTLSSLDFSNNYLSGMLPTG
ncbi:hypothetical protein ACB092_11G268800 [Castanea dentata]